MAIDTIKRQPWKPTANGNYYAPRAQVQLDIPLPADISLPGATWGNPKPGDPVTIICPVKSLERVSNSHLEADTLSAVVDWQYIGVDPRIISSAVVSLSLWAADISSGTESTPQNGDLQFVGIMKRIKRCGSEGQGMIVDILAHDYTTLFLEAKKFPTNGIPLFTDTISSAWKRICAHTGLINPKNPSEILPTVKELSDKLRFVGGATDVSLGKAVPGRIASVGHFQIQPNSDAWAVWQAVVQSVGLISYIRNNECIVTTATDYFTESNPPTFIWGQNVSSIVEDRDAVLAGKGVKLESLDPLAGTLLESFYPPLGSVATLKHKVTAKKAGNQTAVLDASDYEQYDYAGISTQDALDAKCKDVYVVRSVQELEGRLETSELSLEIDRTSTTNTSSGFAPELDSGDSTVVEYATNFNLLTLQSGDAIQVLIDQATTLALGQFPTDQGKIDFLVGYGYSEQLAQIWVANLNGVLALAPIYIVKRVAVRLEDSSDSPRFSLEITYVNKFILPDSTKDTDD